MGRFKKSPTSLSRESGTFIITFRSALFSQVFNHLHNLLADFLGSLRCGSLTIDTDNRFRIALTQMNPFVGEVNLHTVYIIDFFILIQLLHLGKNSIYICFRSQVYTILCHEVCICNSNSSINTTPVPSNGFSLPGFANAILLAKSPNSEIVHFSPSDN